MEQLVAYKVLYNKAKNDYKSIPALFETEEARTTRKLKSYLSVEWDQLCKMAEDKRR